MTSLLRVRCCVLMCLAASSGAWGQVTLTTLVDAEGFSAVDGEFSFVGIPSIDGNDVAFVGYDDELLAGVYHYDIAGDLVTLIADTSTAIPGGTGNFTGFGLASPSIDNGNISFVGYGDQQEGVYISIGGVLMEIADASTAVPGGTGAFSIFGRPAVSGLNVAFHGFDDAFDGGVFADTGGLIAMANTSTTVPGEAEAFDGFAQEAVAIEGASVAFQGFGLTVEGVYGNVGGPFHALASQSLPIPAGTGNFEAFGWGGLSLDGLDVGFNGQGSGGQEGVYVAPGRLLADLSDPPTKGSTTFTELDFPNGSPAISGSGAAYVGVDDLGERAVHAEYGQVQTFVAGGGVPVDADLAVGPEGMDGNRVVLRASGGIVLAELTAPGDSDGDGDVDGVDFAKFAQCFNKAGNPPRTLGCSAATAALMDTDNDGDVDGVDFAKFANCFNKAGNSPKCVE